MLDYSLAAEKLAELRAAHRSTADKREADRIKAVVLLATGWTAEDIAEVLPVDSNTVRNHCGTAKVASRPSAMWLFAAVLVPSTMIS